MCFSRAVHNTAHTHTVLIESIIIIFRPEHITSADRGDSWQDERSGHNYNSTYDYRYKRIK